MTDPEDLRYAIGLVCLLKGWNRKQFAVAARLHRVSVSRIEHGGRTPSTRSEAAIGDAAGLSPETWRDLVAVVGRARREIADGPQTFPKSEKGGDPLAELAAKTIARLGEALETLLSNPCRRSPESVGI